jgi:hypothetical protein
MNMLVPIRLVESETELDYVRHKVLKLIELNLEGVKTFAVVRGIWYVGAVVNKYH